MDANKQKSLDLAMKQIDKAFGKGALMRLGDKNIEPIKAKLSAGFYTESCEIYLNWVKKLKRIIKSLQVDGVVKYGETELTIGKILSLKKGDIINLNKNVGDLLQMEIEGVPKFNCYADIVKSCNTVKVVGKIRKEEM